MPAYSHIYNKGIDNKIIFNDDQDYQVFIEYLREYLSTPPDKESTRTHFVVNGRTYKGTPHQPKNYFGKIELGAYSLQPDHFHLVLYEVIDKSIQNFIRSLCTRYSMYFNKKYNRGGALFAGPYKSIRIKDQANLGLLTGYLHNKGGKYNSYSQYNGSKVSSWVKPVTSEIKSFNPDENQKQILKSMTFEDINSHLEGRDPARGRIFSKSEEKVIKVKKKSGKNSLRIPELFASLAIFIVLLGLGVNNINANKSQDENNQLSYSGPTSTSAVLGVISESPTPIATIAATFRPKPTERPKLTLVVKISDGSPQINIRKNASVTSTKIGTAKEGDIFEYLYIDPIGWYKVVLKDGTGFISSKYVEVQRSTN